jgi:hypothetical protein
MNTTSTTNNNDGDQAIKSLKTTLESAANFADGIPSETLLKLGVEKDLFALCAGISFGSYDTRNKNEFTTKLKQSEIGKKFPDLTRIFELRSKVIVERTDLYWYYYWIDFNLMLERYK